MSMFLLASCTDLANPAMQEVVWCAITMASGGEMIATLILFLVFMYGLHLAKVPAIPSVMVGLLMIFVFRGANTGLAAFDTMAWIAIFAIGAVVALFFWGFAKK